MTIGYGLLVDYDYCTGCHTCEVACRKALDLGTGQFGIKILQDGPRELPNGKWEYNYLPMPTSLCDLCASRTAKGKQPSCVHHCLAGVMQYGSVEDLARELEEKPNQVLFVPEPYRY